MDSFVRIWLHVVFTTRAKAPLIRPEFEKIIYDLLRDELKANGCIVSIINGMPDHVHLLFKTTQTRAVAEIIKNVKGCSAHRLNNMNLMPEKFLWDKGYSCYSVSEHETEKIYHYISNNKSYHAGVQIEYEMFQLHKTPAEINIHSGVINHSFPDECEGDFLIAS